MDGAAQREAFCQRFIESGATAAYDHAFPSKRGRTYAATRVSACRLMKDPAIAARIAELQALASEQYAADKIKSEPEFADRTAETAHYLARARDMAFDLNKPGDAVRAIESQGRLFGLYVDKKDITVGLRPDDARQIAAGLLGKFIGKLGS